MSGPINYKFWTICIIEKEGKILLLDRQHGNFKGFLPPGGKVDFPESFVDSAKREVKEETGLTVRNLTYKGLYEYVNEVKKDRFIIFHYYTKDFEGKILEYPPEGKVDWYPIESLEELPMQESFRRRIPYLLKEGTFEIQVEWDEENNREGRIQVSNT
ncbi:8-oxo-dGTP diphosphatase [Thalassobacillus hwangdonensis]|uniref:8-oxo-dGTP diphosphatase n=1 Tax=Thalassobacillus hwangdonensis TaxID=546108 RepID=A0ABW3L1B8_9BACI